MSKVKLSKKDLKNIEIEVDEKGFVIWVIEETKINGKKKPFKHWVLDASCLKEDGEIRLGNPYHWNINAKFDSSENSLFITRDKRKKGGTQ